MRGRAGGGASGADRATGNSGRLPARRDGLSEGFSGGHDEAPGVAMAQDPAHGRMVEVGAEHGREALRLGADPLREQLASLSQDADLTLSGAMYATMSSGRPAGVMPSGIQEMTRTPTPRREP